MKTNYLRKTLFLVLIAMSLLVLVACSKSNNEKSDKTNTNSETGNSSNSNTDDGNISDGEEEIVVIDPLDVEIPENLREELNSEGFVNSVKSSDYPDIDSKAIDALNDYISAYRECDGEKLDACTYDSGSVKDVVDSYIEVAQNNCGITVYPKSTFFRAVNLISDYSYVLSMDKMLGGPDFYDLISKRSSEIENSNIIFKYKLLNIGTYEALEKIEYRDGLEIVEREPGEYTESVLGLDSFNGNVTDILYANIGIVWYIDNDLYGINEEFMDSANVYFNNYLEIDKAVDENYKTAISNIPVMLVKVDDNWYIYGREITRKAFMKVKYAFK